MKWLLPLALCLLSACAVLPRQNCPLRATTALRASATAPSIVLTWSAPTEFTDGNAIPSTDAVTFNLYGGMQGTALALLQSGLTGTSTTRTNVSGGTHCYALTAVVSAIESSQSAEACATVTETPASPTSVAATAQ